MNDCWKESVGELPATIARIDKKIIIDALGKQSLEYVLNSVEMRNLFEVYLIVNRHPKSHYLDYYYSIQQLKKSHYPVSEISLLYSRYLEIGLPKRKKIILPAFTSEKRGKVKDYVENPEEGKFEEVKTFFGEMEGRTFTVLDEVFRESFTPDVRKYIGM